MFGPPFRDRREAGRRLAGRMLGYRDEKPVVFALPRGGVPVAYEVALSLGALLDVLAARKLGAPGQPELGIGAVAQGGARVLNARAVEVLGVTDEYLERITRRENARVEEAVRRFRGERPEVDLEGKTAILVDDGLATGVTARAAVLALEGRRPRRIVLAAPVCASQTAEGLRSEVDEMVCLETPSDLGAIGFWYRDFEQVTDEEVVELLERSRREAG